MAVPGLASFLAFHNRPQTPLWPKVGEGGQAERGLLGTDPAPPQPALPLLAACLISLSYFTPPACFRGSGLGLCPACPTPDPMLPPDCTVE